MTTLATAYPMQPGETKQFDADRLDTHNHKVIDKAKTYRVVSCKQVQGMYHIEFEQVTPEKKRRGK